MRKQLEEWLKEIPLWGKQAERFRFSEVDGRGSVIFCTAAHTYHLHFTGTYLGATATSRITRPGEDWNRGNDLPDGKFNRKTFDNIIRAVVGYELVALEPELQPVAIEADG